MIASFLKARRKRRAATQLRPRRLRLESLETRSLLAPLADIVNVTPDPRTSPVGEVVVNFTDSVTGLPTAVTGVDQSDFTLTRDGTNVSLASAAVTGSGDTWAINLSSATTQDGAYILTLKASGSGIVDSSSQPLTSDAIDSWTIAANPTASITGITSPRASAVGNVSINFSESVTGVDIHDFMLTRNGSPVDISALTVTGSGSAYGLNLLNATTVDGNYVLTLVAANSGITDSSGHQLVASASASWVTDSTPLSATFGAINSPTNTAISSATVTFNRPVTGVDPTDFTLTRNGTAVTLTGVTVSGTGSSYTLNNLSSLTATSGTYVLTLNASTAGITDSEGLALAVNATAPWTADLTAPTATITAVTPNPRSTAVGLVTITFSEAVTGLDISDFKLTRNGTSVSLAGVPLTPVAGSTTAYTIDLTSASNAEGTYILTLVAANSGITDGSSNPLAGDATTTWVTDQTPPTAMITGITSPRSSAVGSVGITFSEAVTGVDITDFTLTRNGALVSLTGLTVTGSGANYSLNLSTVTATAGSYVLTLNASGSGITDAAGNLFSTSVSVTWLTDTTAPTATFVAVTPNPRTTSVDFVLVNFSEAVMGVDKSDFTLTRTVGTVSETVSLANLAVSANSTTSYKLDFSNEKVDTSEFGTYTLTLVVATSGITDLAGNALTATTNPSTSWVTDDTAPENSTLRTAKDFGYLSGPATFGPFALITPSDWYRFTIPKGAISSVTIHFSEANGDLDLELYNVSGLKLKSSTGTSDSESIPLTGLAAGTYYLRVFGKLGATNLNYSISFNGDDTFEQNDTRQTASNLGTLANDLTISNLVMLDGHDWYRFTTTAKGTAANFIEIDFQNSLGNLDLELYNASGTRLATSTGNGNSEKISLNGRAAGTYYIDVLGKNGAENPNYSLSIVHPSAVVMNAKPALLLTPNSIGSSNQAPPVSSPVLLDALLINWNSMQDDIRKWIGKT